MNVTHPDSIQDFLAQKRLALVGVSRDPRDFTRHLFRELVRFGYDVVPVQPAAESIEGRPCFARLQDIQPPVEGALIVTAPKLTASIVRDCIAAGVKRVWMPRHPPPVFRNHRVPYAEDSF